jgi:hypothetical protein
MRLTYSVTGIPYVEIDEDTRIIFTRVGDKDKHYKWLAVKCVETLNGEVGKGKRRKSFVRTTSVNFMTDMKLRGFPRGLTGRHPSLTKVKHALLKRLFKKMCIEDSNDSDMLLFPEEKLSDLEVELYKRYNDEEE